MTQASTTARLAPHIDAPAGPHPGIGFREFVAVIAALMATNALAIDTMLPALPDIGGALGVGSETRVQWIITAFIFGFGAAQIVYGPISDRVGRRPVLLAGIAGYAVAGIGASLAPSFGTLLAFRVMQGVTVAATRVVSISVVRDCYAGRQMARVMSLAFVVFLLVPVLAPTIGQIIMLVLPWRGLFGALAVYGALVLAWVALRLPETLHPSYRRPIELHTIGRAIALTLRDRQSRGYALAQSVINGALLGFISSIQPIFADVFHAPHLMPPVFAGIAGSIAVASLLNSKIVEKLGTRRVSHAALIGFVVIEIVHLTITLSGHESLWSFAICQAVAMFCFGLTFGNFGAMAMEPLAAVAGTAASTQGFIVTLIGGFAGFAIGQSFDGTTLPMTIGFALAGATGLAIVLVTERGRLFRPQMGG